MMYTAISIVLSYGNNIITARERKGGRECEKKLNLQKLL